MIRVALADDQELVRAGFRLILELEDDIEVVGEAADGRAALEVLRAERPDVALIDVRMPEMDGIEATRRAAQASPDTKVLILTTFDLDEYVHAAMRAGASGFLLKDVSREDLPRAVRTVARGDALLDAAVTRRLVERFLRRPTPSSGGRPAGLAELSDRELEVLLAVARGLSNGEIASELFIAEATVKTHIARLLQKVGCRDRVQLVIAAYESGLVEPGG